MTTKRTITAIAMAFPIASNAATLVGSDFSDALVFNASGGAYSQTTDDLDLADGVTIGNWSGDFGTHDNNSDNLATSGRAAKINGNGPHDLPSEGSLASTISNDGRSISFTITIDANSVLNLTSIDFSSRAATTSASNTRWVAFATSLEDKVLYSDIAQETTAGANDAKDRSGNRSPHTSVALSDTLYQGLTDTSVTFTWYAGGAAGDFGSGDSDLANIVLNGNVTTAIPEPSSATLVSLAGLSLALRRRK